MREIVFDTETTGLEVSMGNRVIEIGAIEMIDRFPTGRTFHHYIRPDDDYPIEPGAYEVHGISSEDLKDKPVFADILDELEAFFAEGNLVAHNAKFDINFLNAEFTRLNRPLLDFDRMVDTAALARRQFPGQRASLDALCARFGISNAHRTLHGALLDAELLADVYLELTGGRQGGLVLDAGAREAANVASRTPVAPQRQRPTPLPSRITPAEKAAHDAFVERLGPDAIWHRLG